MFQQCLDRYTEECEQHVTDKYAERNAKYAQDGGQIRLVVTSAAAPYPCT